MDVIVIPEDVQGIIDKLNESGFKAYLVGGAVRDSFLGKTPKDYDIATNAKPEQMLQVFDGFRIVETGLKHGTITLVVNERNYEVTTFRVDGNYSDNRRPDSVEFVDDITDDLSRRDFTINALAYNREEGLIDPFGGRKDLAESHILCVGNPDDRFNEDALRMLRAIRFGAELGFLIVEETQNSIAKNARLIDNISKERINAELTRVLMSDNSTFFLWQLYRLNLMKHIVPDLDKCFGVEQKNRWHHLDVGTHILGTIGDAPKDLEIRLALMLHDIGKPNCKTTDENGFDHFYQHEIESARLATSWLKEYKFENETIENVSSLVLYHDGLMSPTKKNVKKLLNKLGTALVEKLFEIRNQDILMHSLHMRAEKLQELDLAKHLFREIVAHNEAFQIKDLAVNGDNLISLGYQQGRQIGEALNQMLDMVIESPELNKKKVLTELAKTWLLQKNKINP